MEKRYINFLNKSYPTYEINLVDVYDDQKEDCVTLVAQKSLWELLDVLIFFCTGLGDAAESIDKQIFFYCDDDFFNSNPTYEELIEYLKENIKSC